MLKVTIFGQFCSVVQQSEGTLEVTISYALEHSCTTRFVQSESMLEVTVSGQFCIVHFLAVK